MERKAAIINVSKGLLKVSLVALSAVGGATGNPLLAGVFAIPQTVESGCVAKNRWKTQWTGRNGARSA